MEGDGVCLYTTGKKKHIKHYYEFMHYVWMNLEVSYDSSSTEKHINA